VSGKRDRAIELRDLALHIIHSRGTWEEIPVRGGAPMRMLGFRDGDLRILFRTPFQAIPAAPPLMQYVAAMLGRDPRINLLYGLDIWCKGKVLNIEWADDGALTVVSYKSGEWERELRRLAGADVPPLPPVAARSAAAATRH
jgi:hypothetical protein